VPLLARLLSTLSLNIVRYRPGRFQWKQTLVYCALAAPMLSTAANVANVPRDIFVRWIFGTALLMRVLEFVARWLGHGKLGWWKETIVYESLGFAFLMEFAFAWGVYDRTRYSVSSRMLMTTLSSRNVDIHLVDLHDVHGSHRQEHGHQVHPRLVYVLHDDKVFEVAC